MGFSYLLIYVLLIHILFLVFKKTNTSWELNALMLGIFFYIAFRDYSVGADTLSYCDEYIRHGSLSMQDLISEVYSNEIGYLLFTRLIYLVFPQTRVFLIIHALIVVLCNRFFIKNTCKNNYFLATLGFMAFGLFSFHLSGIRQSIAMSICVVSYVLMQREKIVFSLGLIVLASTFHLSALIFIFSTFLALIWKRNNNFIIALIISFLFVFFAQQIQETFSTIREKWSMYSSVEETGNGYIFFTILLIITFLGELSKERFTDLQKQNLRVDYFSIVLWGGRLVSRTFERPCLYFLPTLLPVMTDSITFIKNQKIRTTICLIAIILISIFYLYRFSTWEYIVSFI